MEASSPRGRFFLVSQGFQPLAGGRAYPTVTAAPWHFLYFLPEPQGQGSLRPTLASLLALGCGRTGPSTLGGAESSIRGGAARCWRRRCSSICSSVMGS